MNEVDLIQALIAASVSGAKIYPISAPASATKPYTTYSVIRGSQTKTLQSEQDDRFRYLFTSWCSTYAEAKQLIIDFQTTLKPLGYMAGEPIIDKDPDTNSFRILNNDWYIINTN